MDWYELSPKILNMSLTASVIIVTVVILRLLLKRAPKVYSYMLWAVVLFRLLCPITINTPLSVLGLFDTPIVETTDSVSQVAYIPNNIVHTENPEVTLPVPVLDNVINNALPQGEEQLVADPLEAPISIATYIWLAGILVMIGYSVVSYIRLRKSMVGALQVSDNIYVADHITTPFVLGIFRPRIYLLSSLSESEQEYILKHEQYHIRRGDHIFKLLAYAALCIHWFNPLVWVAFVLFGKDMEMSCDEAVIRKLGEDVRADYSASLLNMTTGNSIRLGMPLAFGEVDTKGRIKNLAAWKKPTFWVTIGAILICIVGIVICVSNPKEETLHAPEPFGHSYRVEEILFVDVRYSSAITPETAPRYQFTSDYAMFVSGDVLDDKSTTEWVQQWGKFEEVEITTENFDNYFNMTGFTISNDAWSEFRSTIKKAWRINVDNSFYYFLQTKDGSIYLTYGYDIDNSTNVLEEGSHIRFLFRLERTDILSCNAVSVDCNAYIEPAYYPNGFDWEYDDLYPSPVNESGKLVFTADWDTDVLVVSEDYYKYTSDVATIEKETYELNRNAQGKFELEVAIRGDNRDEAVYFIQGVAGVYVMKIDFQTAEASIEIPETEEIVNIVDRTETEQLDFATAQELFFEDADNRYYFPHIISQYVIVQYADGTSEDIVSALETGKVVVKDLDRFGIDYITEPKMESLDSAILNAIVEELASSYPYNLYHCASFVELHREEICGVSVAGGNVLKNSIMVYGMALEQSFSCSEGKLNQVGGGHMPVVITFEMTDNTYKLTDFWIPRDGSYYVSDIREKFPDEIEEDALDTQKYVVSQIQECYSRAIQHHQIDTEAIIDELFNKIESSPATSSNPADYIDAHSLEYRELTYYGQYSLSYIFNKFIEGKQTGLRGQLMRILLDDLAPEAQLRLYAETGQEYFDEWAAGAVRVLEQHDMEWIKENQPAMWIYLQMVE